MKGKAGYSWPPDLDGLFYKNEKYFSVFKAADQYKEINRTDPSLSVRIPCIGNLYCTVSKQHSGRTFVS